jgi:hypothetical protein
MASLLGYHRAPRTSEPLITRLHRVRDPELRLLLVDRHLLGLPLALLAPVESLMTNSPALGKSKHHISGFNPCANPPSVDPHRLA